MIGWSIKIRCFEGMGGVGVCVMMGLGINHIWIWECCYFCNYPMSRLGTGNQDPRILQY